MRSLKTPWPASSGPAPGPETTTSPTGSARQTTAFTTPATCGQRIRVWKEGGLDSSGEARRGELERHELLDAGSLRTRCIDLRSTYVGDPAASDVIGSELVLEHQGREDHRLRHRVKTFDVRSRVALREPSRLCLGERLLVRGPLFHARQDEVGRRVENAAKRGRCRPGEAINERAQEGRSRHDGRLGPEGDAVRSRHLDQLQAVQGHRPLVRCHHRDPVPQRLAHVREARLAALGRARGHLDEHVGLGRPEAVETGRKVADTRQSSEPSPAGHPLEDGDRIEPSRVRNEAVARVGDGHDLRTELVSALEPGGVLVQGADEPPSDRAQPDDHDPNLVRGHRAIVSACRPVGACRTWGLAGESTGTSRDATPIPACSSVPARSRARSDSHGA